MFQSKNLVYFLLAVLVGIFLGVGLIYLVKAKKNYVAVFFNNGGIYFGKLSTFPKLKLKNALFIQVDQTGQASFQRFSDAFWGPRGLIYLNRDSILFIAPLSETSPLVNLIEGRQIPQAPTQPQPQTQPQQSPQGQQTPQSQQ